jgi:hypothetical protein
VNWHSLVLADAARVRQISRLGHPPRIFADYRVEIEDAKITWAVAQAGDDCFACTWLGPGWVFDAYAQQRWAEKYQASWATMTAAGPDVHGEQLAQVVKKLRLGVIAERLLWLVHSQMLSQRTSLLKLPDVLLAEMIWGPDLPGHWRQEILEVLQGLSWLHVAEAVQEKLSSFGTDTALLTHVSDLREGPGDECTRECAGFGGPAHHHYLINVGRGFLGVLEQLAEADDETGVRTYHFPAGGKRRRSLKTLRAIGKTGRLVSVYLPAKLGRRDACASLSAVEHRILQALMRETMRAKASEREEGTDAAIVNGNVVRGASTRGTITCQLLDSQKRYVGFNGNGLRRGQGYLLVSENGWLRKANCRPGDLQEFLTGLAALSSKLGLIVVALEPSSERCHDLEGMREMATSRQGQRLLRQLHVRVYAEADYLARWNHFFSWPPDTTVPSAVDHRVSLDGMFRRFSGTQRSYAEALGVDASMLGKVLKGKKPCPESWLARATALIASASAPGRSIEEANADTGTAQGEILAAALDYLRRDWSVVPQLPGRKHPCIKWKPYQARRPDEEEVRRWFTQWPGAGIAAVLGPVSGLFIIDVDGEEAHQTLIARLGNEPAAPKVLSGSGLPYRYHLYFRHPDLKTRAKLTPWHENLEFRGEGGLITVPPSIHQSGDRYAWAPGRSVDEMPLPALPAEVLAALQLPRVSSTPLPEVAIDRTSDYSQSTQEFLAGRYANGPRWNERLFRAACDLAGRGITYEVAEPLLLQGAQPWNDTERENSVRTIKSAYSQVRVPGKV